LKNFWFISIFALCLACSSDSSGEETITETPQDDEYIPVPDSNLNFQVPSNFPDATYDISNNQPTQNGFELGKKLFYDGKLASDNVVSCGFCHIQDFAFTHHTHIVSHGVDGALGTRNAQPLFNLAFLDEFTWDGAAQHLDTQPIIPITTDVEMNSSFNEIISKLSEDQTYQNMFKDAFDNGEISSENILKALSQFMVMMVSSNSKYDQVVRNEGSVFTEAEEAGLAIFEQKCASCHAGPLFTDQSFRNNGLPVDAQYNDIGRKRVTGLDEDLRKFRVPTLRNIEVTFPYMHDGRFQTLTDVLDHYSDGVQEDVTLDPVFVQENGSRGIPLSNLEKDQLVAFLKTLTDNSFIFDDRFSEF